MADGFGRRALVYAPDGNLVRELGGGRLKSPYGIAVSTDGSCIFVSDRRSDKILRFDALGNPLLAFDERLRNPSGLALDALGHLLVADRNNDRIAVFGLPVGVTLASYKVGTRAASAAGAPGNMGTAGPAAQSAGLQAQGAFAEARLGEEGGVLTMAGLGGALIPKGALDEDFDLSVFAPEGSDPQAEKKRLERETLGLGAASDEAAYGPHGLVFDKPVTLVLPFDKGLLLKEKLKVSDLKAYYWDEKAKNWAALASVVDEEAGVVRAQTGHFSIYQVMGVSGAGSEAAAEADTAFAFRDLYVYPNPARAGAKPVIHLAVGLADGVTIRIFDVSGRQVHEANVDKPPAVIDDGTGPKYAYEYAWDGHIPSGVYFYTVEAKKSGQGSIRKAGKLAVVR